MASLDDLAAFVVYSSITSLMGNIGQSNYSAANSYMDALVRSRVRQGMPGLSIQWPAVAGVGMAAAMDTRVQFDIALTINDKIVKHALCQLLSNTNLDNPVQTILPRAFLKEGVLPSPCKSIFASLMIAPINQHQPQRSSHCITRPRKKSSTIISFPIKLNRKKKKTNSGYLTIESEIVLIIQDLVTKGKNKINNKSPFMDMGLDSLASTQMVKTVNEKYSVDLPPTALFDFPTIAALASHLSELADSFNETMDLDYITTTNSCDRNETQLSRIQYDLPQNDIAIVGMSCRFAGGIEGPEMLWETIKHGKSMMGNIPFDRWDADAIASSDPSLSLDTKQRMSFGGFVHDLDMFDASVFNLSPAEAAAMDPQQRLLLEYAYLAFHDAGLTKEDIEGTNVGVFVGMMTLS